MYPPYQPPINTPANCAVSKTAMARERVPGPWAPAVRATAGGIKSDSVMPIKARHARSETAEFDNPVRVVTPLQRTRLKTTRNLLENRSPICPAIGEHKAYTQRKIEPVRPS